MSADLQWMLLRKQNRYVFKRNNAVFTAEPYNLVNKPSYKFCGMVNRKAVGVAEKDGKIVLQTKRATRVNKKAWAKKALVKSKFANHKHQAAVAITAAASNRKDLAGPAIARYHAIKKQQQ